MAEVGQKLSSGACRLSALRTGHTLPVIVGGAGGGGAAGGGHADRPHVPGRGSPAWARGEDHPERRSTRGKQTTQLDCVKQSKSEQEKVAFLLSSSCELGLVNATRGRAYLTALHPSCTGLWTRRAASSPHPDSFTSPQRAFCTVIFSVSEHGQQGRLKLCPDFLKTCGSTVRHYSWSSEDPPLLQRSKTAFYDILKVSPTATQSQIKTAYYKQSFIYHPDKNSGSKEATRRFSDISEAYTVLGNISLRRKYDRGMLSESDLQSAGRPSSKEPKSRSTSSAHRQQRARRFTQPDGKPIFDFDAFYQAHYGEQLRREREQKARKKQWEEMQKKKREEWREEKLKELTGLLSVITMGGLIINIVWRC